MTAAAGLLLLVFLYSRFAAVVLCTFSLCAVAGCLVSLSVVRNKLVGFTLALGVTSLLSFASYLMLTMIIKKADLTLDELNWLLVIYLICLVYSAGATLVAYPILAPHVHRFLSPRFHHPLIPYGTRGRHGNSRRHPH